MSSWIKPGLDVMRRSYAEYLDGSITYVKHPPNEEVHRYYINLPERTVVLCFTELASAVTPLTGGSVN